MKIAFTASLRGKKFFDDQYKKILASIEKQGHENLSKDLLNPSQNKVYTDIQEGGRDANIAMYRKKIKDLQSADICVFECSTHSLAIGFMVQQALHFNKPTLVLYYKDNSPDFLAGVEDEKLIVKSYDETSLEKVIKEALEEAESQRDKRFNFFINPDLLNYLNKAAKKDGVTKSTFIRNLILEYRKKSNA